MDNPVSVGVAFPFPNNRFRLPEKLVVSFPTGSACHWNVCATALLVALLKTDADKISGSEFSPAVAVALPIDGKVSAPRMVPPPATSSVLAGVVVLIPILAVLPEPDWNIAESPKSPELSVQRGT